MKYTFNLSINQQAMALNPVQILKTGSEEERAESARLVSSRF